MAEYIEREAALKTLEKSLLFCESELETGEYRKGCIAAIQDDIGNIKHLPAADVVEVKHGYWKQEKAVVGINPVTLDFEIGDTDRCSVCTTDFVSTIFKYKYCPNCGAKMDLKEGAENAPHK